MLELLHGLTLELRNVAVSNGNECVDSETVARPRASIVGASLSGKHPASLLL